MDALAVKQATLLNASTAQSSVAIESKLPVDQAVRATISQVITDPKQPNVQRVRVELPNGSVELAIKTDAAPLEKGAQVVIQRNSDGKIQLTLLATQQSKPAPPPPLLANSLTQPQTETGKRILTAPVVINASGKVLTLVEVLLPKGQAINAQVVKPDSLNPVVKVNGTAINTPNVAGAPNTQTSVTLPQSLSTSQTTAAVSTIPSAQQATVSPATLNAPPIAASTKTASVNLTAVNAFNQIGAAKTPANIQVVTTPVTTPASQPIVAIATPNTSAIVAATPSNINTNTTTNSTPTSPGPITTPVPLPAAQSPAGPITLQNTAANTLVNPTTSLADVAKTVPMNATNAATTSLNIKPVSTPASSPTAPTPNNGNIANTTTRVTNSLPQSSLAVAAKSTPIPAPPSNVAASPISGNTINSTQNFQLNNLQSLNTPLQVKIAGQTVSLQAPANLPNLQSVQITRSEGLQANIQWQQPVATTTAPPSSNVPLNPQQVLVLEQSLRQALPQQIPIAEGINQLVQNTAQINNVINTSVDKVALSIMQLFGVKPGSADSGDTIKRNVQQGGLFTESNLAKGSTQGELKGFLSQLRKLADTLPKEQRDAIKGTVERMLSRVTANQITHVQQQHARGGEVQNERSFQLDIPVHQEGKLDNVEMEIKQRKHQTSEGEFISIWSVKLHFDLQQRGEVDAEVALNPTDNSISTTFHCTNPATVREIEQQMPSFRQQLSTQGFEIQTLHCTQGSQASQQNNPISKRYVDITT